MRLRSREGETVTRPDGSGKLRPRPGAPHEAAPASSHCAVLWNAPAGRQGLGLAGRPADTLDGPHHRHRPALRLRTQRPPLSATGRARPDHFLEIGSDSPASQTAAVLARTADILRLERPAAAIVIGDTTSTLGCALAANKEGVPLVHVEAGLRSTEPDLPEEANRRVVDILAHLLCAPSARAASRLRSEGTPGAVVVTGMSRATCRRGTSASRRRRRTRRRSCWLPPTGRPSRQTARPLRRLSRSAARLSGPPPAASTDSPGPGALRAARAPAAFHRCAPPNGISGDHRGGSRRGRGRHRLWWDPAGGLLVGNSVRDAAGRDGMGGDRSCRCQRPPSRAVGAGQARGPGGGAAQPASAGTVDARRVRQGRCGAPRSGSGRDAARRLEESGDNRRKRPAQIPAPWKSRSSASGRAPRRERRSGSSPSDASRRTSSTCRSARPHSASCAASRRSSASSAGRPRLAPVRRSGPRRGAPLRGTLARAACRRATAAPDAAGPPSAASSRSATPRTSGASGPPDDPARALRHRRRVRDDPPIQGHHAYGRSRRAVGIVGRNGTGKTTLFRISPERPSRAPALWPGGGASLL